ncbi:MAG: sterol desaturase family protein [Bacteroidota bacterium]
MDSVATPQKRFVFLLILIFILVELIWSYRKSRKTYDAKDTLANIAILVGFQLAKLAFLSVQLEILAVLSQYQLFAIPKRGWSFLLAFIWVDFVYYWYHRLSHTIKFLWAFHMTHHSSIWMNFTTAYRLNWFSVLLSPLVFGPLVLLGFPIQFIVLSFSLNLLYQFFLHTEMIGKLGVLEYIINTPSSHRVHHGSNPKYIDKNFGGVFIIWDLLFQTYQKEEEKPRYGITKGFISNNPIVLNIKGFVDLFKRQIKYKG